jgi:hypothetical protein
LKICKLGKMCDRKKCKDLHIAPTGKAPVFIPGGIDIDLESDSHLSDMAAWYLNS